MVLVEQVAAQIELDAGHGGHGGALRDLGEIRLVAVKMVAREETTAHLRPARALGWTGGAVEVLSDG